MVRPARRAQRRLTDAVRASDRRTHGRHHRRCDAIGTRAVEVHPVGTERGIRRAVGAEHVVERRHRRAGDARSRGPHPLDRRGCGPGLGAPRAAAPHPGTCCRRSTAARPRSPGRRWRRAPRTSARRRVRIRRTRWGRRPVRRRVRRRARRRTGPTRRPPPRPRRDRTGRRRWTRCRCQTPSAPHLLCVVSPSTTNVGRVLMAHPSSARFHTSTRGCTARPCCPPSAPGPCASVAPCESPTTSTLSDAGGRLGGRRERRRRPGHRDRPVSPVRTGSAPTVAAKVPTVTTTASIDDGRSRQIGVSGGAHRAGSARRPARWSPTTGRRRPRAAAPAANRRRAPCAVRSGRGRWASATGTSRTRWHRPNAAATTRGHDRTSPPTAG